MTTLEKSLLVKGLSSVIRSIPFVEEKLIGLGYFTRVSDGLEITDLGAEEANLILTEFEEPDSVTPTYRWEFEFEVTQPLFQKPAVVFREVVRREEVSRAVALVAAYSIMRGRYQSASIITVRSGWIEPPQSLY